MRAALECCGEFLSHIGALEEVNAITEILRHTGVELPESSPYRLRALLAAIRRELDAEPIDVVFMFERLNQLNRLHPSRSSTALFNSPLFFHLLVARFAVAFEGLDEEIFKLESDELCHAEGIYETCLLIQDQMNEGKPEMELTKFLATFEKIFKQDEPKDSWDAFYDLYCLNDAVFRRDMKRALWVIESVTLGPTTLEQLVLPTESAGGIAKVVPRAMLEKRFGGTRQEWQDLAQIYSISDVGESTSSDQQPPEQEQEHGQEQELQQVNGTSIENGLATESECSDISERGPEERQGLSSPCHAAEVSLATRQVGHRAVSRKRIQRENGQISQAAAPRLKRVRSRWSVDEESALIEGYGLYHSYANVWVLIKSKFPDKLRLRSNVDLKDKYRNLVKYGKVTPVDSGGNPSVTQKEETDENTGTQN